MLVGSPAAGTVSQGHAYLVFGGPDLPANMNLESNMTGQNGITFKGALTGKADITCLRYQLCSISSDLSSP